MSPFPTPCKGKSKSQPFAHTFALTGRRRLCADTQGVALGCGVAALSGRSRRGFELIEFLQRGCGLRRSSLVGLRRRNNEFNELTNCWAARVRGLPLSGAAAPHPSSPILLSEPNPFHIWIEAIRPPIEEKSREESANDINEIMCFDIYRGAAQQHV